LHRRQLIDLVDGRVQDVDAIGDPGRRHPSARLTHHCRDQSIAVTR